MNSRKEALKRYNEKKPTFPIRMPREILEQIPGPKSAFILEAIKGRLEGDSNRDANRDAIKRDELLLFLIRQFIQLELVIDFPNDLEPILMEIIQKEI